MLNTWHAFMLGLIQGIAEFLPISSSGHLTLFQLIYDLEETPLMYDILLHMGTLAAVVTVYWRALWDMVRRPLSSDLKWLVVATLPAVVAALLFEEFIYEAFKGQFLGICFLLTSAALLVAEALSKLREARHTEVGFKESLVMGVMQAFAILPGLSRSGATISGGLGVGLTRKRAADFSFMMSIPAILGSAVMSLKDVKDAANAASVPFLSQLGAMVSAMGGASVLIIGFVTAAVSGFLAIKLMLHLIRRVSLSWFALYTGILGGIVMVWQMLN